MVTPPSQLLFFPDEWPDGLTYLENYIQEDEAVKLVHEIDAAPWRTDLKRRVQHYGYRYDYKARQARREDYLGSLPDLLQHLAERLTSEGHFQAVPDQVIVNEYLPGQGISAHIDCQPCFGETIASLSLLVTARLGPPAECVSRMLRDVSNDVIIDVSNVVGLACAVKFLDLSVDVDGAMTRSSRS